VARAARHHRRGESDRRQPDRYQLLILPNCACLSDGEAEAIRAFVRNGGSLLSAFDTGFFDEEGRRAATPKLADVQGIAGLAGFLKYSAPGGGYQRVMRESYVTRDLSGELIPAPLLARRIIPSEGARIHTVYLAPMPSCYTALPEAHDPGIIENSYGKGRSKRSV
jgi:hypothetical protein